MCEPMPSPGHLRHPGALAALVGVVALGTPPAARAQATDPNVLYACYVPSTGTVYRIKASGLPDVCDDPKGNKPPHVMFSWNQQGPQGPQGPQGAPGPQGAQGPQGTPGVSGYVLAGQEFLNQTFDPGHDRNYMVSCPGSKKVLGGGVSFGSSVDVDGTGVFVRNMAPNGSSAWLVTIANLGTTSLTTRLFVLITCADAG